MKPHRIITFLLVFLFIPVAGYTQNPIVPPGMYIADPSAHVWNDGKLYVYGSRDESPDYYCSWNYHVLSTSDLKNWTIHENSFASKGVGDEVSYSDTYLWAPDVQYRDGIYYLYYCLGFTKNAEGVATSDSPTGPFVNGTIIKTGQFDQIDPCVFIDDDGKAYYIWGQGTAKMALMKSNMMEIDSTTIRDGIVTEKEHRFHEGGYMVKRKGIYYLVYAALSIHDMASCISYATSDSPWGPFKYGGAILNNDHSDPANWNNHGSLVEFNAQWYVFYHRATHGSYTMRKACVEPITFNDDGSISEVEMTTQGASGPLDARNKMDAERACMLHGNLRIKASAPDNEELTEIREGDRAAYKYLDFGDGVKLVTFSITPGKDAGNIEVAVDMPWSWAPATVAIPGGGDGNKSIEVKAEMAPGLTGVHAVWLRFKTEGNSSYKVDWFRFE
jgi:arabinoxylan arabinofuranohydrolase